MNTLGVMVPLLGEIDLRPPVASSKLPRLLLPDVLLILGIGISLMVLLILWVVFVRKRRKPRTGQRITYRSTIIEEGDPPEPESGHGRHSRRHRRRRRDHRTRNPTLAETGGLPPAQTDESSRPTP